MHNLTQSYRCAVAITVVAGVAGTAGADIVFSVAPDGFSGLDSQYIYTPPDSDGAPPPIVGGGEDSGLVGGDTINAFSRRQFATEFLLCFSVDGLTGGNAMPAMVDGLPPYNVMQQAERNQQAGDAFISTEVYDRFGGADGGMNLNNNFLVINQSPWELPESAGGGGIGDPGDFGLGPRREPDMDNPPGGPIDDVGGGGIDGVGGAIDNLYFTLDLFSPSLFKGGLPAETAADIVFDPQGSYSDGAGTNGGDEVLYASYDDLGLFSSDDIDALSVYDEDGVWNEGDQVFFSLTRDSPTLMFEGWSAADILTLRYEDAPTPGGKFGPYLFASHEELGLGEDDSINMLELVPLIGDSAQSTIEAKLNIPAPPTMVLLVGIAFAGRRRRS